MLRKLLNFYIILCVLFTSIPRFVEPCVDENIYGDSFERAWNGLSGQGYERQFKSLFGGIIEKTKSSINAVADDLTILSETTYDSIKNATFSLSDKVMKAKNDVLININKHKEVFNETLYHLKQSFVNNKCVKEGLSKGFALFDEHKNKDITCIDGKVNDIVYSLKPLSSVAKQAEEAAVDALKKTADCLANDDTLLQLKKEPCLLRVSVESEATKAFIKAKHFVLSEKMKIDLKLFSMRLSMCNMVKKAFETGIEITKIIGETSMCFVKINHS